MVRAKRHYIPSHIWHIIHRCHKREFLLKFVRDRRRWIEWLYQAKKRKDSHSVFAAAVISELKENNGMIDGARLFKNVRRKVVLNPDQTPEYGDIRKSGHEGGISFL